MNKDSFLLVNAKILPDVIEGVLIAKELLASGQAANVSQAVKMAGISRSAFYKYRDCVFRYTPENDNILKLQAVLSDRAGVLSALTTVLYKNGGNIITVNQSAPTDGTATASMTVKTDSIKLSLDKLMQKLGEVDGVISIKSI